MSASPSNRDSKKGSIPGSESQSKKTGKRAFSPKLISSLINPNERISVRMARS
jgi:hypothetical protein